MEFQHLFSPFTIKNMTLRNRIVMTAMHLGYTPQGEVTDRLVDFYVERSRGGAGLMILGGCPIDDLGGMVGMVSINDDRFIPGLTRLTRSVHEHGAKMAAQLYQAGRYTHSAMIGGRKPVSASAVRSRLTGETPRALELDEIANIQDCFAQAANRAVEAGFDAVEILGSAGYLISQFLSPITNLREDAYGGSFENRMRFGLETIQKVRDAVAPDYPVMLRIAGNDFMKGGNTNREARIFAAKAEEAGVDLFNVTGGWHETRVPQLTMGVPRKAYAYLARGVRSEVNVPVIASNRINDPRAAEEVLESGAADLVTIARGLIADPELPNKARDGKPELIYHCVACNQGCFDAIFQGRPAGCMINPRAGFEEKLASSPAANPRKILVVGGGPAGMKAACTAAERGHAVTLVEKNDQLGGQMLLNRRIPGREELVTGAVDLENNLKHAGVDILMGKPVSLELIKELAPDAVVMAVGAQPVKPDIPGIDGDHVIQAWRLLDEGARVGPKVTVLGGNAVGLETALYLASQGTLTPDVLHFLMVNQAETFETITRLLNRGSHEVTVVEMTQKAGADVGMTTRWTLLGALKRLGARIQTQTRAVEITRDGLVVEDESGKRTILSDAIVLAAGSQPEHPLSAEIQGLISEVHVIGDAQKPRNAMAAIREGFELGLKL